VVGGLVLDAAWADHLARLTGARVEVLDADGAAAVSGTVEAGAPERVLSLAASLRIRLQVSQSAFRNAEEGVGRAVALLVAVSLLGAILLALFVSRRITRPVEALTAATRSVAGGEWATHVEIPASGEVAELVAAFNRMTSDLKAATERLVASERVAAWQEVARRLAHEIKNPLTPIQMSLETLLEAQRTQAPRFAALFQESAGAVLEEVERLKRIVDEFSRFARLPKPQMAPVDLSALAHQSASLFASSPGVELRLDLAAGVEVTGDRDQLTQVLVNLLKNALEAMPAGGALGVQLKKESDAAILRVSDSGPGLRPEDLPRVFEPYFTTKASGTGLGLAIAARIAQEHGGRLEAGGELGQGAVFTLRLPMRP